MKKLTLCLTLLVGTICFAQQQGQPPPDTQQPPYGTPGTFPGEPQASGQPPTRQIPPDEKAPPPQALSSEQVQQQITSHLKSEPALKRTKVDAQVNDSSVVLTGNVSSEEQHDIVLRIAQSYAGDRKIVDKVKVTQVTSGSGSGLGSGTTSGVDPGPGSGSGFGSGSMSGTGGGELLRLKDDSGPLLLIKVVLSKIAIPVQHQQNCSPVLDAVRCQAFVGH